MLDVTVLVKIQVPYQVKRMLVRLTVMFCVSVVQCNVLLALTFHFVNHLFCSTGLYVFVNST